MSGKIEEYAPASGRVMREDSSIANIGEAAVPSGGKGQGVLAATTTAAPLSATAVPCSMVQLQNDPASTINILYGYQAGQPMALYPGQSSGWIPIKDAALIYAKAASGTANVNWIAL